MTAAAAIFGCSHRQTTPRALTSGREIQVLRAGLFNNSFLVEYCADIQRGDRAALGRQADEVFESFRSDVGRSRQSEALLWPTTCRWSVQWHGWRPAIVLEESTAFRYLLNPDGTWTRGY